jgi:hypothetical protein
MRFHQLLLEFDLSKTIANYGEKVYDHLAHDISFHTKVQIEAIREFTAAKFHTKDAGYGFHLKKNEAFVRKLMTKIAIEKLVEADPTPNKKYSQWICARYGDYGIARGEDLQRVTNALTYFDQVKNSGYFRRNADKIAFADINRFKKLTELEEFLESLPKEADESKAYQDRRIMEQEAQTVYDGDQYKIVIPKTVAAATAYGRNTKWCTTSENGGAFDGYNRQGPLYIIIQKATNRKWQFHFESGQFMDASDRPIYWDHFPDEVWGLIEWPWDKLPESTKIEMLATGTPTMIEKIATKHKDVLVTAAILAKDAEQEALLGQRIKKECSAQPDKTWDLDGAKLYRFENQTAAFAFDLKRFKMSGIWVNPAVMAVSRAAESRRQYAPKNYGQALSAYEMIDVAYILDAPGMKRQYIFVYNSRGHGMVVGISTARLKDEIYSPLLNDVRRNIRYQGAPAQYMEPNPIWEKVIPIILKEVE